MVRFTSVLSAVLAVIMTPIAMQVGAVQDWKTNLGWDGEVSTPNSIGLPLGDSPGSAIARAAGTVGGIFICDGLNWTGTCGYAVQPLSTCIVLGTDWNNKIASLGPDPGAVVVAWNASNCAGAATAFVFPGSGDLKSIGWADQISSFMALAF